MKITKAIAVMVLLVVSFTACKKDNLEIPEPTIVNVEVGLNNNEIGVIGQDFHFNADILAGDRIDVVQVKIQQRNDETYASAWGHEVTWEQYRGAKSVTVHKHFDIPAEAVAGTYDFLIMVTDQNGTQLEERRSLTLYTKEDLPVDPRVEFGFEVGGAAITVPITGMFHCGDVTLMPKRHRMTLIYSV